MIDWAGEPTEEEIKQIEELKEKRKNCDHKFYLVGSYHGTHYYECRLCDEIDTY